MTEEDLVYLEALKAAVSDLESVEKVRPLAPRDPGEDCYDVYDEGNGRVFKRLNKAKLLANDPDLHLAFETFATNNKAWKLAQKEKRRALEDVIQTIDKEKRLALYLSLEVIQQPIVSGQN